ncbi:MAG TPA: hypothetical protein VG944_05980 [Fimbriimonas sp.]|nr:hypothetical protein [Fimbriimonas sp.]
MAPIAPRSRWQVGILTTFYAFLSRRQLDIPEIIQKWGPILACPSQSVRYLAQMELLAREWELFEPEYSLDPECLKLQTRIFELRDEYPVLRRQWAQQFQIEISHLVAFTALSQAHKLGASSLRFVLQADEVPLEFLMNDKWAASGQIPLENLPGVRGALVRAEAFGFENVRRFSPSKDASDAEALGANSLIPTYEELPEKIKVEDKPDALVVHL